MEEEAAVLGREKSLVALCFCLLDGYGCFRLPSFLPKR